MLDPTPQYASDLEWMLQSSQAPRELILEALLQEHYSPIYHFAYSILDDRKAASAAAKSAFSRALLELHRFRPQEGVQVWLYRIVLEACQRQQMRLRLLRSLKANFFFWTQSLEFGDSSSDTAQDAEIWLTFDNLEKNARHIMLLGIINDWQPAQIASLFNIAVSEVNSTLQDANQAISAVLPLEKAVQPVPEAQLERVDPRIIQSLHRRWSAPILSPAEFEDLHTSITHLARWTGLKQRKTFAALEAGFLALIILIAFASIWGVNTLWVEKPTITSTIPVQTYIVTKIIYRVVTATPNPALTILKTSTPILVPRSNFTYIRSDETLQDVADRLDVSAEALRQLNRLPIDARLLSGQRLVDPQYWRTLHLIQATPIPPLQPFPSVDEPVSALSVLDHLMGKEKRYVNLWFDAQLIDYGPASYIGHPRVLHAQVWAGENQELTLIGALDRLPEEAFLRLGEMIFLASPSSNPYWFSEWRSVQGYPSDAMESLRQLAYPRFDTGSLLQNLRFRVVGHEELAGRPTINIEMLNGDGIRASQIWIDHNAGFILRRINYHPGDKQYPAQELMITAISYNINFPQELFDLRLPWRGGYAQDYRGEPLPLASLQTEILAERAKIPEQHAPQGFDPSQSHLSFQYPEFFSSRDPNARIQLFADQYFLGQALFGNPWDMICDRSPSGLWIAYVSQPTQGRNPNSILSWFKITNPSQQFYLLNNQLGVTELAFSPDSKQLAFFSRQNEFLLGSLSILDLINQDVHSIIMVGDVKSLVWSPDGEYLAMIVRLDVSSYLENVIVVDAKSGKTAYIAPLDVQSHTIQDWPMTKWGVEFPVEMGGMDSCANPHPTPPQP